MAEMPDTAMVLAAGLGKRMRPLTQTRPKPLIEIAGRCLLDRGLDALKAAGIRRAVVNIHWHGDQVIAHLAGYQGLDIAISDERGTLLDSAGGIVKALPELGPRPFVILNADTFWIERDGSSLRAMAARWNDEIMDMMLLLAVPGNATGHTGGPDFVRDAQGRLARASGADEGYIYAGAAIVHPRIFAGATSGPHSLNLYFDRLIGSGRLSGHVLDGDWITVGTPEAIAPAEAALARAELRAGKR